MFVITQGKLPLPRERIAAVLAAMQKCIAMISLKDTTVQRTTVRRSNRVVVELPNLLASVVLIVPLIVIIFWLYTWKVHATDRFDCEALIELTIHYHPFVRWCCADNNYR